MSAGYLAALAARTLGVAPVLRPPTPSRFEPERPQAELTEATYVVDAAAPAEPAGGLVYQRSAPVIESDRSVRGRYEPDMARENVAYLPAADNWLVPHGQPETAGRPALTNRLAPRPQAAMPPELRPHAATWPAVEPAAGLAQAAAMPLGPRASGPDDVAEFGHLMQRELDGRGEARQDPARTEPEIIVHIGRVEVRAVQAPPPPVAAPRSRPPAQPSLADYLLARDRGRR